MMATKIYIDQGHNSVNPNAGAEGFGYREQDVVYRIGVILSDILERRGYETRLSRASQDTVLGTSNLTSLQTRVNDANSWGADYFISLHTNASANPAARGSEALVYSTPSVASGLAEDILRQLNVSTGLPSRGVTERPGLYVLRRTRMPATLLELGFITNRTDAELMANSPELFAVGIADGISEYLGGALSAASYENGYAGESNIGGEVSDSISYEDFLKENSSVGVLKVQAYRAGRAYPAAGVEVKISRDFDSGDKVFFSGLTDENGIIDGIELPAPPRENSLKFDSPDKVAVYKLRARLGGYENVERAVEIFGGIKTIQPLAMQLKRGGEV